MDTESLLSVYLALAGMLATLVTLIVAGLIAVFQIIDKQIPKRSLNSVIPLWAQISFITYSSILFIAALAAAWLLSTNHNIFRANLGSNEFVSNSWFLFYLIIAMLIAYGVFFFILFRSRVLFDNAKYIGIVANRFSPTQFADYLFGQYASAPFSIRYSLLAYTKRNEGEDELEEEEGEKEREVEFQKQKAEYETRIRKVSGEKDSLGELFQYAFRSTADDEVEDYVLPLVTDKLVEFVQSEAGSEFLGEYLQEEVAAMLASASGKPRIGLKKAFVDMMVQVAYAAIEKKEYALSVRIASQIHLITKDEKADFLRLYSLKALEEITDKYNEATKDITDARAYMEHYEAYSLIAARMAENYYHNLDRLNPVAIVEDNHHENEEFTDALVNYLVPDHSLTERFEGVFPVLHFDAIDLSAEALAGAMKRSDTVLQDIGATRYSYGQSLSGLYYVFYDFGKQAFEKGLYDIVQNVIFRLSRGLRFMETHDMKEASQEIADYLYSLGVMVASLPVNTSFGQISYKDKDEIAADIVKTLNEHIIDMDIFKKNRDSIEHSLFDYLYKPGVNEFVSGVDWERDELPLPLDMVDFPTSRKW